MDINRYRYRGTAVNRFAFVLEKISVWVWDIDTMRQKLLLTLIGIMHERSCRHITHGKRSASVLKRHQLPAHVPVINRKLFTMEKTTYCSAPKPKRRRVV